MIDPIPVEYYNGYIDGYNRRKLEEKTKRKIKQKEVSQIIYSIKENRFKVKG